MPGKKSGGRQSLTPLVGFFAKDTTKNLFFFVFAHLPLPSWFPIYATGPCTRQTNLSINPFLFLTVSLATSKRYHLYCFVTGRSTGKLGTRKWQETLFRWSNHLIENVPFLWTLSLMGVWSVCWMVRWSVCPLLFPKRGGKLHFHASIGFCFWREEVTWWSGRTTTLLMTSPHSRMRMENR